MERVELRERPEPSRRPIATVHQHGNRLRRVEGEGPARRIGAGTQLWELDGDVGSGEPAGLQGRGVEIRRSQEGATGKQARKEHTEYYAVSIERSNLRRVQFTVDDHAINDRVERPATLPLPRRRASFLGRATAAHDLSRSARTRC